MDEVSIEYYIEVVNIPTMMKQGSSLLLVLVSVLGSTNRSKHSTDLPKHDGLSESAQTVFDDVEAPVSDTALDKERRSELFVKTHLYGSSLDLNESCREMWKFLKAGVLCLDCVKKGRLKKRLRPSRLLQCCCYKISRYKPPILLAGMFQEHSAPKRNNRYRQTAFSYGFYGMLQILTVTNRSMSNVTSYRRGVLCFIAVRRSACCGTSSEILRIFSISIYLFVLFHCLFFVTTLSHIAYIVYVEVLNTHLRLRNDCYVIIRRLTNLSLVDILQVTDKYSIAAECFINYLKPNISINCPTKLHKFEFVDLFSQLHYPFFQFVYDIPQHIFAFPLIGSLNDYLRRVQKEPVSREDEMCYEVRRLQSYNGINVQQSLIKLARSGFYATGNEDETRCYSCGATHRNWVQRDQPDQVHRRLCPGCPHRTSGDSRNIPISSSDESHDRIVGVLQDYPTTTAPLSTTGQMFPNSSASDSSHQTDEPIASQSPHRLDISKAVYPQFKDRQSRLESFRDWRFPHVQDPQALTDAGFYYAGYRDCVRCFYCGLGLKTWEQQDDPWVMHVRWRSTCDYVRELRGEEFIQHALNQTLPTTSTSSSTTSTARYSLPVSDHQPSGNQQVQTTRDTRSAVGRAVEMGFEREAIETALSELESLNTGTIDPSDGVSLGRLVETLILATSNRDEESRQTSIPPVSGAGGQPGEASGIQIPSEPSSGATTGTHNPSEPSSRDSITRAKHIVNMQGLDQISVNSIVETGVVSTVQPRVISPAEERRLAEENESLREESTCKVCMDNQSCIVFLPCGHLVTCAECAPALRRCPICRSYIRGSVRAHTTHNK